MTGSGDRRRRTRRGTKKEGTRCSTRLDWRVLALAALLVLPLASVAQADFEQAMNYFKAGKYVEAAGGVPDPGGQTPRTTTTATTCSGCRLLQMGKPAEAEKNFQKAIELERREVRVPLRPGQGLLRPEAVLARWSATLKTAEPLATDAQTKLALYTLRGYAYSRAGEVGATRSRTWRRPRRSRRTPTILAQLGKAYYGLGHNDKAAPAFREALQARPNDAEVDAAAGRVAAQPGRRGRRRRRRRQPTTRRRCTTAEKYLQAEARTATTPSNLVGRAALGAGEFDKAEQAFRKVLAQKPDYCYAMINLGKTFIARERLGRRARRILERRRRRALRAWPWSTRAWASRSQKQKRLRRGDRGLRAGDTRSSRRPRCARAIERCQENIEVRDHNVADGQRPRRKQAGRGRRRPGRVRRGPAQGEGVEEETPATTDSGADRQRHETRGGSGLPFFMPAREPAVQMLEKARFRVHGVVLTPSEAVC